MNLEFTKPQNLGSLLIKLSQSNFNLRSPGSYLVRSYLITTVSSQFVCPSPKDLDFNKKNFIGRLQSMSQTKSKDSYSFACFIKQNKNFHISAIQRNQLMHTLRVNCRSLKIQMQLQESSCPTLNSDIITTGKRYNKNN